MPPMSRPKSERPEPVPRRLNAPRGAKSASRAKASRSLSSVAETSVKMESTVANRAAGECSVARAQSGQTEAMQEDPFLARLSKAESIDAKRLIELTADSGSRERGRSSRPRDASRTPSPKHSPHASPSPGASTMLSSPLPLPPHRHSTSNSPSKPQLRSSRSEARLLAGFRRTLSRTSRSHSRARLTSRPENGREGSSTAQELALRRWQLARRFMRWMGAERARKRRAAAEAAAVADRKEERRARQAKASRLHTERREAAERARLIEKSRVGFEEHRARTEGQVIISEMLARGAREYSARLRSAAEGAASRQAARAAAAAALPAAVRSLRPGDGLWEKFGGRELESMLADLDLVDARWLVDLADMGGVLPRWQQVPTEARIGQAEAWRLAFAWHEYDCLAVLVLS